MVNRVDGIILGVGVVVLVASIIGVVLYDEGGDREFTISWAEGDAQSLEEQEDSGQNNEFTFSVPVNGTNIAQTVFLVEVAANGQQISDDSVDVDVAGPQDQSGSCSFEISAVDGGSNSCEAVVDVNERPSGFSITAENQTAAEDAAAEQVSLTNGTGTWEVTVTIDGGQEIQDPSYAVTLAPSIVPWVAEATLPTSGPGSGPG